MLNWFRPKWKHSNSDVRQASLADIKDPEILVEVIVGDSEWFIRHEAMDALRAMQPDQSYYHRLMRESGDEEIRRKVVKVMTDEAELKRVAETDQYRYIRGGAELRLEGLRAGIWDHTEQ